MTTKQQIPVRLKGRQSGRGRSVMLLGWLFLLTLVVAAGCATDYTVSQDQTQAVNVPQTPDVVITTFAGPIEVVTGEEGQVKADLTRRSSNPDRTAAQAEVDGIAMSISQSGPDVSISIVYDGLVGEEGGAEAVVVLAVPPGSTVRAETPVGELSFDEQIGEATGVVGIGSVTFTVLEEEPFSLTAEATNGELLSDVEALSSRPLFGIYEGQVGEEAGRQLSAVLDQGRVYLRLSE